MSSYMLKPTVFLFLTSRIGFNVTTNGRSYITNRSKQKPKGTRMLAMESAEQMSPGDVRWYVIVILPLCDVISLDHT